MFVMEVFMSEWNNAQRVLEFKEEWFETDDYFSQAVSLDSDHRVLLEVGKTARSSTPDGRKVLFVGATKGTVAVFENNASERRSIIVFNEPSDQFKSQGFFPRLTDDNLMTILGHTDIIIN